MTTKFVCFCIVVIPEEKKDGIQFNAVYGMINMVNS